MLLYTSLLMSSTTTDAFTVLPNTSVSTTTNTVAQTSSPRLVSSHQRNNNRSFPLFSTVEAAAMPATTITVQPVVVEDEVIGTRPKIVSIESAEDYLAFLQEGENDEEERLAVVK